MFLLPHEKIGMGRGHPSSHRCAENLVHMRVHEFKSSVFEDEIKHGGYYAGWWTL